MFFRLVGAIVLCVSLTSVVTAEENCGAMVRTATRFQAIVRSIEPIGRRELKVAPIDGEMLFVVTLDVKSVDTENPALKAGDTRHFGVHSPSRTLGADNLVGETVNLEAEWMTCDSVFRRFVSLRKLPSATVVEEPDDWLEVGHTYRAKAQWVDSSLRLVTRLHVPMHHSYGVEWANLDAFPRLARDGAVREIGFKVASIRISQLHEREWVSIYVLEIVGDGS